MRLPLRLRSAFHSTKRWMRKRWLWAAPFILWELFKDRAANWANTKIDENEGIITGKALHVLEWVSSQPYAWTIIVFLAILLIVFIHAYISDPQPDLTTEVRRLADLPKTQEKEFEPNYSAWAKLDPLELWQVACLWEGIEPQRPIPRGAATIRFEIFRREIFGGKLDAELGRVESAQINIARSMKSALGARIPDAIINEGICINRASLREYADKMGENPLFISGEFRPTQKPRITDQEYKRGTQARLKIEALYPPEYRRMDLHGARREYVCGIAVRNCSDTQQISGVTVRIIKFDNGSIEVFDAPQTVNPKKLTINAGVSQPWEIARGSHWNLGETTDLLFNISYHGRQYRTSIAPINLTIEVSGAGVPLVARDFVLLCDSEQRPSLIPVDEIGKADLDKADSPQ